MKGKFGTMLIRRLVEFITTSECLGCQKDGTVLCSGCMERAHAAARQVCFRCGRDSAMGMTCAGCRTVTSLSGISVGAPYDGAVKDLILKLKFHRLREAAEVAAELMLRALPEDLRADAVTAVPISPHRYRERGYNQAELLAREVARRLRLPYASLLARETSAHQLGLDRAGRLAQIKGAFYPIRSVEARAVIVVDDVVTTGATLMECANVLKAAGVSRVWGAVVARHQVS